jgi:FtsP/CotA-like multicopper oxidase with cupredoxin domain
MTEWNEAEDVISDVLRIELTASEQGYNGEVPGPTVEAVVGERLIVRLTNQLPVATCFCIDCACGHTAATPPGETGEYSFALERAGTFRYCGCGGAACLYGVLKVLPGQEL